MLKQREDLVEQLAIVTADRDFFQSLAGEGEASSSSDEEELETASMGGGLDLPTFGANLEQALEAEAAGSP